MSLFVVQRWSVGSRWEDVLPPISPGAHPLTWDAENAGQAFHDAVIDNEHEHLSSTSYRVLLFEDGATFNVTVNIDAAAHERTDD